MKEDAEKIEISDHTRKLLEIKCISRLEYDGTHDRESPVEEAHKFTFWWVFERLGGHIHT